MNPSNGLPGGPVDRPVRRIARFGVFEFDLDQGRLTRNGHVVKIQQQPAMVLACLVRRPGALVTREELQQAVWPSGTWVEFDYSLNTAINRIRRTLGDTASEPRFLETVPKRGYRFIAPVELVFPVAEAPADQGPILVRDRDEEHTQVGDPATMAVAAAASPAPTPSAQRFGWWRLAMSIAVVILLIAGAYAIWQRRAPPPADAAHVLRSNIVLPPGHRANALAISPQGDQIAYETLQNGRRTSYRRNLDSEGSRLLPGAETGADPFFSPDGSEIGFYTGSSLRIAGATGFRDIAQIPPEFDRWSTFWSTDGWIYFTSLIAGKSGIWRVSPAGGTVQPVLEMEASTEGVVYGFIQQVLRGGDVLLYSINLGPGRRSIRWLDRKTGATQRLVERGMGGTIVGSGHLLYYWRGSLMAAPINEASMRLAGSPVEVLNDVAERGWSGPNAAVSANGTLVYVKRPPLPRRTVEWVTRDGKRTPLPFPPAAWEQVSVSPDGQRLALVRRDDAVRKSLWSYELRGGGWTKLIETDLATRAAWSPDSKSVVASFERDNADFVNLYRIPIAEPQNLERLTEQPDFGQFPQSWSAAANAILFLEGVHPDTKSDIFVLPLAGDRRPRVLVATPGWDTCASFAPDGKRFAYASERGRTMDVFIQDYPGGSKPLQISRQGGREPSWAPDGKRIYFLDLGRNLMEVTIGASGAPSEPKQVLPGEFTNSPDIWTRGYSIAPDGRLLVIRAPLEPEPASARISVVSNWFEELKRLSPLP